MAEIESREGTLIMAQSKVTPLVIILSLLLAFCPTVTVNAVVDPGQLSIEDDVKAIKEKFQKQMEELRVGRCIYLAKGQSLL